MEVLPPALDELDELPPPDELFDPLADDCCEPLLLPLPCDCVELESPFPFEFEEFEFDAKPVGCCELEQPMKEKVAPRANKKE